MMQLKKSILILLLGLSIVWFSWRLYSNRHHLPCPAWLSWMLELNNPFAKAHATQAIIDSLPIKSCMNVLDVGCGPGRVLIPLAQKLAAEDGHVTGLDMQVGMLEKARAKASKLKLTNIDFACGNVAEVQLRRDYDVILMVCVLGEIPKDERELTLKKISNHLQPQGIVSITESIFDPHFQRHKTVVNMMSRAGFKEVFFTGNWLAYTAHFKKQLDD